MAKIDKDNHIELEDNEVLFSCESMAFDKLKKRYKGKSLVFDLRSGYEKEIFKFFAENINFFELKKITAIYDNVTTPPFGTLLFFAEPTEKRINYKFEIIPTDEIVWDFNKI